MAVHSQGARIHRGFYDLHRETTDVGLHIRPLLPQPEIYNVVQPWKCRWHWPDDKLSRGTRSSTSLQHRDLRLLWLRLQHGFSVRGQHIRRHRGRLAQFEQALRLIPREHYPLWPEHWHCANHRLGFEVWSGRCHSPFATHFRHAFGVPRHKTYLVFRRISQVTTLHCFLSIFRKSFNP